MKTTQTKHTATPWRVEIGQYANQGQIFIEGCGEPSNYHKQHVAQLGRAYDKQGEDQREANAAFIVTACNAHEELVRALEAAHSWLEPAPLNNDDSPYSNSLRAVLEQIEAALAKAKATTEGE